MRARRNPTDAHFSRPRRRLPSRRGRSAAATDGEGVRRRRHRRARSPGGAAARRRRARRAARWRAPRRGPPWSRGLGATPVRADLFDPDAVRRAVAGHEAVCNLATHIPPTAPHGHARGLGGERPDPDRGVAATSSTRRWPTGAAPLRPGVDRLPLPRRRRRVDRRVVPHRPGGQPPLGDRGRGQRRPGDRGRGRRA